MEKDIDIQKRSQTAMYQDVFFNTDSTYLYILGGIAYISVRLLPEQIRWSLDYPGYRICLLQLLLLSYAWFFFAIVQYLLHKVRLFLRLSHFKFHHDCSFEVGSSRCAIASEGGEALLRDLLSAIAPTYIIGTFGINFYGYLLVSYYSAYFFFAKYAHTGVSTYHALHHGKNRTESMACITPLSLSLGR